MNEIAATPIKRTTECQDEREKRDLAVYNDINRLAADPTLPR